MHSSHPTSTEGSPTSQTRLKDWRTHSAGWKTQGPLWSLQSRPQVMNPNTPRLPKASLVSGEAEGSPDTASNHLLGCSLTLAMPLVHTVLSLTESDQRKVIPCLGGVGHRALWAPRPGPHTWRANPDSRCGSRRGVLSENSFLFTFCSSIKPKEAKAGEANHQHDT